MELLPGFVSGLSRVIISYPFDYIKCHIQTNKSIDFKTLKFKSLYKGCAIPFATVPIDRAITFYLYDKLKSLKYSKLSSSLIVNIISCIYNVPIQVYNLNYILKDSTKNLKLYRGTNIEYIKNILGGTIFLYSYDTLKKFFPDERYQGLVCGSLASIINWSIIYPIDTIKVLIQTDFKNKQGRILKDRLSKEGIRGIYKGISWMYMKSVPSASIGMMMYELTKKYFN